MADPISALAAYVTAQVITAIGTTSVLAAEIVYGATYAVGAVAASAGLSFASQLLGGGTPSPQGQSVSSQAAVEPNRHLIGRGRVYGVTAWQGSFAWKSGDKLNQAFGQMQVISSTPITEIEKVLSSDIEIVGVAETLTGSHLFMAANMDPYNRKQGAGKSRLYYNTDIGREPGVRDALLGWYADQIWQPLIPSPYPDPNHIASLGDGDEGDLVPFYSEHARGDGLAKLSSVAFQDFNSFPQGPPRMSVVGKGIKAFDPRDPDQGSQDPTTWQFTENPALLAAWYITRPFGFAAAYADIDFDTLITSANACEELVETYASTIVGYVNQSGDVPLEQRYRCGGEVIESEDRDAVLASIVACMAGSWCQTGGKWFLYAGVFSAPTESIDDTWLMRNIEFTAQGSRMGLYNTVSGTFMSEARRWQAAPYPQVQVAALLADDNGQEIVETIDLAYVPSSTQAQRCMLIELRRSHKPRAFTFEAPVGFAMRVVIGQTIALTQLEAGYGIDDLPFRVTGWELAAQDDTGEIWVKISLDEDGADIYASTLADLKDADALTASDQPNDGPQLSSGDEGAPTGSAEGVFA